jgi:hypothetical protein
MITYDQVVSEMATIICEAGPEHAYQPPAGVETGLGRPMCFYVHEVGGGSLAPGCIVGVWLNRFHGVALETLHEFEGKSASGVLDTLQGRGLLAIELRAAVLVNEVQKQQDGWDNHDVRVPWQEALYRARRLIPPLEPVPA